MTKRPLRRLLRAERLVVAKQRGTPNHRAMSMRRPPDQEARREDRMRRFLRGWSQRKGGGWSIREAPYRPVVPEMPCEVAEPKAWNLPLVPWGWETDEVWQGVKARVRGYRDRIKQSLRLFWRHYYHGDPLPKTEAKVEEIGRWSLAALAILVLTLVLPQKAALWCVTLFGVVQGMQVLDVGSAANDGTGDPLRTGGSKLNANMAITLMCAATLNAGFFAVHPDTGVSLGYTAPQIVQAAINSAGGTPWYGKDYTAEAVFVSKRADGVSLLPYDANPATGVVHNATIHMIREGGNPRVDVYTPQAYGATGNNSHDDYYALAAMFSAIDGQSALGSFLVDLETAFYKTSKPLWVTKPVRIVGTRLGFNTSTTFGSAIGALHVGGPILAVQSSSAVVGGLTTGITSSAGSAWSATNNNRFLTLRNYSPLLDLTGLSAITVECYFKGTGSGVICRSQGRAVTSDTLLTAMSLDTWGFGAGTAMFYLTLSGGFKSVTAASSIRDGNLHHIAGTYDGTTVRLFVDGVLIASTVGSGTIAQDFAEDVTCGVGIDRAPEQTIQVGNPNGAIDSLRISNTARYTAGFTPPTAKLTVDGNTLALLNFDEQIGAFTKMSNKDGVGYCWENDKSGPSYGVTGFELDGVLFYGNDGRCTPIHFPSRGQYEWSVEHIDGRDIRCGIIDFDGYDHYLRRFFFIGGGSGNGRYGIVRGVGSAIGTTQDGWTQAFQCHIIDKGSGQVYSRIYLQQDTRTYVAMVLNPETSSSGPFILDSLLFNNEVLVDTTKYRTNLLIGNTNTSGGVITARSCVFENAPNGAMATPWIIADSINTASFTDCMFRKGASAAPTMVMKALGAFRVPVVFTNCQQIDSWVRWSDVAGTAVVGQIGKGLAITFGAAPTLDCSLRDQFEIGTLTGNITLNFINVTPGQRIGIWTLQNGAGGWTITMGTVNGSGAIKGATAATTSANQFNEWVFEANLNGNMTQIGFTTGT